MATLDNTAYTINPLLRTTSSPSVFQGPISGSTPGAKQYASGGQATMVPPTVPSLTKAPTSASSVAVSPEPTIGETLTGIKNKALTIQEQLNQMKAPTSIASPTYEQYPTYKELYPEIDQREIDRRQRRLFQSEIDATNRVYDDMLAQERLAGQGRLGTGRAIAARGGLLGSDFGEAQRQNIIGVNLGAERAVQNERMAKIGSIMGTMRKAAADELAEKRAARQEGAENYINYLASARERKENNRNLAARAILDAGMDITDMDEKEIAAIGKDAGLSAQEIIMAYNDMKKSQEAAAAETDLKTRKTEAEIAKLEDKSFNLSEGQARYDSEGNLIASRAKTYAPGTGSGSSLDLTGDGKRTLLGGGWTESEISTLQEGVKEYGLQEVIAKEKANGATPSQIAALEKAYKASGEDGNVFLTADYFKSLFGDEKLAEAAKEAGTVTGGDDWIPFNESGDTETYVNQLMATVELYRQAGYTDQEILKMMQ